MNQNMKRDPIEAIHPNVIQLIRPIIDDMTKIYLTEQQNPNGWNPYMGVDPNGVKLAKLRCVHMIWDGNKPRPNITTYVDDKGEQHMKCAMCGREIGMKFDKTAIDTLNDARAVVEQIMFVGLMNHMEVRNLELLIQVKSILPYLSQMAANLNKFVKRDDSMQDNIGNIGKEYQNGHNGRITSGF